MISGTTSGNVTEAGGVANGTPGKPTATGDLNSTDVDNLADSWQAVAAARQPRPPMATAAYALSAAGRVEPTRSTTAMPTVQALNIGQTLTDTLHRA